MSGEDRQRRRVRRGDAEGAPASTPPTAEPAASDAGAGAAAPTPEPAAPRPPAALGGAVRWVDERTGFGRVARKQLHKVFPDHWSFLLGEVALFSFVVLLLTGTYLTFFYRADSTAVTYQGPYGPLDGAQVSSAFDSVMRLSFEVRAGLLFRQIHHWAALLFLGAIVVHLARIFLTGAFRRPREINWIVGFFLLVFALAEGFTGYSLPDDLLSGTGLRIAYSAALSIPFVGPWLASLIFGGTFPGSAILGRLFVIHVMLLPGLLIAGIGLHLLVVWMQKHTQFRGPRATESNVIGLSFWPGQVFRSAGLFFLLAAVVALLGGLIQINPVWLYGPYQPYLVSSPAQPDWYIGWLEGSLRIGLPIEITVFGVTIPAPFVPGIVIPGVLFGIVLLWPFIEKRITHDAREHNLLDRPWENPFRLATGLAILTIFATLTLAGANDVISVLLNIPVEWLTTLFRILIVAVPVVVWVVSYVLARERIARSAEPEHPEGVLLRRTESGGFEEVSE